MTRTDYALLVTAALCLVILGVIYLPPGIYGGVLGIVGVVVGVLIGYWLRRLSEQGQRKAERDALLRLLSIEIAHNSSFSNFWLVTGPLQANSDELDALTMDTWKSARVRLAQLVPTELTQEDFDHLARYYLRLHHLISLGGSPGREKLRETEVGARLLQKDISKRLTNLEGSRVLANAVIKKYIEPTNTSPVRPEEEEETR